MNNVWSTYVQKAETLYKSRAVRFSDTYRQQYMEAFRFCKSVPEARDPMRILEIGCGPGALCSALKRWYPDAQITGLDRDSSFIRYAAKKAAESGIDAKFVEGDILSLPFEGSSFDATTSHTVAEHIRTDAFFAEQYRVLKAGGVCTVLSARTGMAINPESWNDPGPEEKAIMEKTEKYFDESLKKYSVCQYPLTEQQLPQAMEAAGFRQVSTRYIAVSQTPDSADVLDDEAIAMIESKRQTALDCAALAESLAPGVLSEAELQKWRELANKRFDRRIEQYKSGEKLWDTQVSVIMIARAEK